MRENRVNASEEQFFQKTALIYRDTRETLRDTGFLFFAPKIGMNVTDVLKIPPPYINKS